MKGLGFVLVAWLFGVLLAATALFVIYPPSQCTMDPLCAAEMTRWWHMPVVVIIGTLPGSMATIRYARLRRHAA